MIQLSLPAQDTSWGEVNSNTIDVKALILYPYYVEADARGNSFDIKKEDVYALHDNYNAKVKSKWQRLLKMGKTIPLRYVEHAANILDHDPRANNIVGHVIGELEIVEKDEVPYLFATLRVKGKENVERVKDKRFSQVSIGISFKPHMLNEISWVVAAAIPEAGAIMANSSYPLSNVTNYKEYNSNNVLNLRLALISEHDSYRNKMDDIQREIEVENLLTSLAASGKLLPRDKLKIKTQLKGISDKEARFAAFNLLAENLINVVDYSIRAKNKSSINWEDSLMPGKKNEGILDLQKIANNAALFLAKGHKPKLSEKEEEKEHKLSEPDDEADMSKNKHSFSKKDMEYCMSIDDKKELKKYLSTFLSEEEEEEDEKEKEKGHKEEKEKGKFSAEVQKLNSDYAELKKQNDDILKNLAVLSKGNEESVALFKQYMDKTEGKIAELSTENKEIINETKESKSLYNKIIELHKA